MTLYAACFSPKENNFPKKTTAGWAHFCNTEIVFRDKSK